MHSHTHARTHTRAHTHDRSVSSICSGTHHPISLMILFPKQQPEQSLESSSVPVTSLAPVVFHCTYGMKSKLPITALKVLCPTPTMMIFPLVFDQTKLFAHLGAPALAVPPSHTATLRAFGKASHFLSLQPVRHFLWESLPQTPPCRKSPMSSAISHCSVPSFQRSRCNPSSLAQLPV